MNLIFSLHHTIHTGSGPKYVAGSAPLRIRAHLWLVCWMLSEDVW